MSHFPPPMPFGQITHLASERCAGPEDVTAANDGSLLAGLADGRIIRLQPTGDITEFACTGGRPLGMRFVDDVLYVADARRGLLSIDSAGRIETLLDSVEGRPLRFPNAIAVQHGESAIYLTDSSTRFGLDDVVASALQNDHTGRVIRFCCRTQQAEVIMDGLHFANGLALSLDGTELFVAETFARRILRLKLRDGQVSAIESVCDNLPGYPDNLSIDSAGLIWVALYADRSRLLEFIQRVPPAGRLLSVLPGFRKRQPRPVGRVMAVDSAGNVKHHFYNASGEIGPISGICRSHGDLYLVGLHSNGIARMRLPESFSK